MTRYLHPDGLEITDTTNEIDDDDCYSSEHLCELKVRIRKTETQLAIAVDVLRRLTEYEDLGGPSLESKEAIEALIKIDAIGK